MAAADIDTLIEEGLTRYGRGDLDGALLIWEEALSIDPDNAQANSYVDYVRDNYDLLTGSDQISDEATVPFGIEDDEYTVEIIEGQTLAPAHAAPMYMDPLDEGWFIDDEPAAVLAAEARAEDPGGEPNLDVTTTYTIEADEPPSFDTETREYDRAAHAMDSEATVEGVRPLPDDDDEPEISVSGPIPTPVGEGGSGGGEFSSGGHTPGFGEQQDSTPVGFAAQVTDVKQRDLGFVQVARPAPNPAPEPESRDPETREPALPEPEPESDPPEAPLIEVTAGAPDEEHTMETPRPRRRSSSPPELNMTLRTPTRDRIAEAIAAVQIVANDPAPPPSPPLVAAPSPFAPEATGAEHTHFGQAPHIDDPIPSPSMSSAPTRELPYELQAPALSEDRNRTRDLSFDQDNDRQTSQRLPLAKPGVHVDISAPTRELGMRPTRADIVTSRLDSRSGQIGQIGQPPAVGDGTRSDIVLPFDPIDARSAQILDDVDDGAPPSEPKEDRTRRRITALIERAAEWHRLGELDRAVAAIDLALAEDPNSALAQKMIHRNRDAIMSVFQGFIGDLQRAPLLARPLHELASAPISPRAAFLLSRVDGTMSIDEILDVSGMPRLEAYRYLCQLLLRGILR